MFHTLVGIHGLISVNIAHNALQFTQALDKVAFAFRSALAAEFRARPLLDAQKETSDAGLHGLWHMISLVRLRHPFSQALRYLLYAHLVLALFDGLVIAGDLPPYLLSVLTHGLPSLNLQHALQCCAALHVQQYFIGLRDLPG